MQIGKYLKKLRLDKDFTLAEVASRTDMTPSLLSQIENGKATPSLNSLEMLLKYYAINFSDFFKQLEHINCIVVKKSENETIKYSDNGFSLTMLASKLQNNALETYIAELNPGSNITTSRLAGNINGERVIYIMSGSINIVIDGKDKYELEDGDSINYKASISAEISNSSNSACKFLISGIPPVFF